MPPRELFAGPLYMSYGQAYVMSAGGSTDVLPVWGSKTNGLCGSAAPGSLWFVTASFDGDVFWRIVLAEGPGNPDEWEEVVEGSFTPAGPPVELHGWGSETVHPLELPMQQYGFWFCGRGLDGDRDGAFLREEQQPDEYELRLWPEARPLRERVVKTTTAAAAYWHDAAARARSERGA